MEESDGEPSWARGWEVVPDSSCGWEYVSDVIYDTERLRDSLDSLFDNWFETNEYCGTHIHVGGLSRKQVHALAKLWEWVDVEAWAFANPHAERETYCEVWSKAPVPDNYDELMEWWYEGDPLDYPGRYDQSRYAALNLNSWFVRRTVEFRLFNACESREQMETYIDFCLYLCKLACYVANDTLELSDAALQFSNAIDVEEFPWREEFVQPSLDIAI